MGNIAYLEPRFLMTFIYLGYIYMPRCVCVEARWQTLEEDSRYHLGSKCQSHVVRLGGKCLYLLSHLTGS